MTNLGQVLKEAGIQGAKTPKEQQDAKLQEYKDVAKGSKAALYKQNPLRDKVIVSRIRKDG